MPPKTSAASKTTAPRKNDRKKNMKPEEAPAAPSGPIIRSTITKAPPARGNLSFLDAINSSSLAASQAAAAKAPLPTEEAAPAPDTSSAATEKTSTPRQPSLPGAEPVVAKEPESKQGTFNWAEDDYTNTGDDAKAEEVEPEEPAEKYAVSYPEEVLANRAEIVFKAPSEEQLLVTAFQQLRQERQNFENARKIHEAKIETEEAELSAAKNKLQKERDNLEAEQKKVFQLQSQLAVQQQQLQHQHQPPLPHVQQPLMNPMPQMPPAPSRYNSLNYGESWDQLYGESYGYGRPYRGPRTQRGNAGPYNSGMNYGSGRSPGPNGPFVPNGPRPQGRPWSGQ